ncbi:MAG: hypothetical protein RQ760_22505, partial [Sedimentisphaerales bacterium]|nr:hypothetical protein [Sedimentisphaerales bacterium]
TSPISSTIPWRKLDHISILSRMALRSVLSFYNCQTQADEHTEYDNRIESIGVIGFEPTASCSQSSDKAF